MKYQTEEQKELKKFGIVLAIVVILILGVFGVSKLLMKQKAEDLKYQDGSVSTTEAIVGTILNQKEEEYYILAYDYTLTNADVYKNYATNYTQNAKNKIKVYYLDLSSAFNKDYYVKENSNPKATTSKELKMKDGTLLKIKSGKIVEYIEGLDKIAEKFKVEK